MNILDRADLLPCGKGDKVYLYKKGLTINKNFSIETKNLGTILHINQEIVSDEVGSEHLEFCTEIQTADGKIIKVKDPTQKMLFRKLEFIPLIELDEFLEECRKESKEIILR